MPGVSKCLTRAAGTLGESRRGGTSEPACCDGACAGGIPLARIDKVHMWPLLLRHDLDAPTERQESNLLHAQPQVATKALHCCRRPRRPIGTGRMERRRDIFGQAWRGDPAVGEADGEPGRFKSGKRRTVADEVRGLESKLASQILRRKRAQDFLIDGTLDRAEFDRQMIRIAEAQAQIEKELSELRNVAAEQDANAAALGKARSVLEEWQEKARGPLTFQKRRAIVEALVQGVTVTPREGRPSEVCVRYRFLPHARR